MIESFKHKGLEKCFTKGSTDGIQNATDEDSKKIAKQLGIVNPDRTSAGLGLFLVWSFS